MLGRYFSDQTCSVARSLEVVGERWSLLIVRDILLGINRFDDLVSSLGITRTVLSNRLHHLVDEGVLEKRVYQNGPNRSEYLLTDKGMGLTPVIAHLMWWGDSHYPEAEGPPRVLLHHPCGGAVSGRFFCSGCASQVEPGEVMTRSGPGLRKDHGDCAERPLPPVARTGSAAGES
ncbi:winged helix-turn-helix transcriptional regulator [Streptomyces adustus]